MHSWVFRNREELARIYGLARSAPASSRPPSLADPVGTAATGRVVPMARADNKAAPARSEPLPTQRSPGQAAPRLPLARLGRFVLRPQPRARRTA